MIEAAAEEFKIMKTFATKHLPTAPDAVAPDGSDVRILLDLAAGGMAHFELGPGKTSKAVTHRSVEVFHRGSRTDVEKAKWR